MGMNCSGIEQINLKLAIIWPNMSNNWSISLISIQPPAKGVVHDCPVSVMVYDQFPMKYHLFHDILTKSW